MTRSPRLILPALLFAMLVWPASATAQSAVTQYDDPLLSGYGAPGAAEQVLLQVLRSGPGTAGSGSAPAANLDLRVGASGAEGRTIDAPRSGRPDAGDANRETPARPDARRAGRDRPGPAGGDALVPVPEALPVGVAADAAGAEGLPLSNAELALAGACLALLLGAVAFARRRLPADGR